MTFRAVTFACALGLVVGLASDAFAIPAGWTCIGTCGTLGPNGDVTAPPTGTTYDFVSTNDAPDNLGLNLGFNETNGSILTSTSFTALGAEQLVFYFNYVTSDGAGFPEYAWAQLLPQGGSPILLFTARTCEEAACDSVPGTGMPPLGAGVTLVPPNTPINAEETEWSPLGGSSGSCFAVGCGNTGWIQALYTPAAGTYQLQFGVVNVNDEAFDSGLAIAGASIGGTPIDPGPGPAPVPEPSTLLLLGGGAAGLVARARRRRHA